MPAPLIPSMRFVPGQVCLLINTMPGLTNTQRAKAIARLPAALNDALKLWLAEFQAGPAPAAMAAADALGADIAPVSLGNYQPNLRRSFCAGSAAVSLAPGNGPQLAAGPTEPRTVVLCHDPAIADVPALVKFVNDRIQQQAPAPQAGLSLTYALADGQAVSVGIQAISPNWLIAGAPRGHAEAGPGSLPEPASDPGAPFTQFQGVDAFVNALTGAAPPQAQVVVAVIDTCPVRDAGRDDVQAARGRYPNHSALGDVHANVHIDAPRFVGPDGFTHLDPQGFDSNAVVLNWQDFSKADPAYRIPDHGLFVAGVVRSIDPRAEVHLIRALSDTGVGDMFTLIQVLSQVPDALVPPATPPGQRRLIVNLSLVADVPSSDPVDGTFRREWFPAAGPAPLDAAALAKLQAMWLQSHAPLQETIRWLAEQRDVLVVAAAGNDALDQLPRPEPRLPAGYNPVLAVAATRRDRSAAGYSNRGDLDMLIHPNAVATFGGQAVSGGAGQPPRIVDRQGQRIPDTTQALPGDVDAVLGIFVTDPMPVSGKANPAGWAYWSGTSFAAPIISAAAARIWAAQPNLSAAEVLALLRPTLATHSLVDNILQAVVVGAT